MLLLTWTYCPYCTDTHSCHSSCVGCSQVCVREMYKYFSGDREFLPLLLSCIYIHVMLSGPGFRLIYEQRPQYAERTEYKRGDRQRASQRQFGTCRNRCGRKGMPAMLRRYRLGHRHTARGMSCPPVDASSGNMLQLR